MAKLGPGHKAGGNKGIGKAEAVAHIGIGPGHPAKGAIGIGPGHPAQKMALFNKIKELKGQS